MNRRTFVKNTSLVALTTSLYLPSCRTDTQLSIIDTHQHLWDLSKFPLGWVSPPLDINFLMDDYQTAIEGSGVVKAIYMEVAVPEELRNEEAQWALALAKNPDNPTVAAVICANPTDQNFESYMDTFEGNPFLKGIRYFFSNKEEMLLPQVIKNIRLLGEMGLSFDLNLSPEWLPIGNALIANCPDTQFILNHCGNADPVAFMVTEKAPRKPKHDPDQWMRDIELISQQENIVCKISGLVSRVPNYPLAAVDLATIINHCLESFSMDRVIFAGDWPVCLKNMPLARWIEILKEVVSNYSITDQRKLFYDNALYLFKLDD